MWKPQIAFSLVLAAKEERPEALAAQLPSRDGPGPDSKTHPIFDPIPLFLFNLNGKPQEEERNEFSWYKWQENGM